MARKNLHKLIMVVTSWEVISSTFDHAFLRLLKLKGRSLVL